MIEVVVRVILHFHLHLGLANVPYCQPFFHILASTIVAEIGEDNPQAIIATTVASFILSSFLTGKWAISISGRVRVYWWTAYAWKLHEVNSNRRESCTVTYSYLILSDRSSFFYTWLSKPWRSHRLLPPTYPRRVRDRLSI